MTSKSTKTKRRPLQTVHLNTARAVKHLSGITAIAPRLDKPPPEDLLKCSSCQDPAIGHLYIDTVPTPPKLSDIRCSSHPVEDPAWLRYIADGSMLDLSYQEYLTYLVLES